MADLTAPSESTFQRRTRRLGLYVLAPLLLVGALPVSVHIVQKPDFGLALHRLEVQAIAPGGPAEQAGLRKGDRVTAVGDAPIATMVDWFTATAGDYSLAPRRLTVLRGDQPVTASLQPRRPSHSRMVFGLSIWLVGLLFLMIGWWVHSRRHDAVGRSFFGLCFIFAFFLADIVDLPNRDYQYCKQLLRELLQYLWPVYFLRFFLLFPSGKPQGGGTRGRLLFVPASVLISVTIVAHMARIDERSLPAIAIQLAALAHFVVYFVVGLGVFARNVLRRDRPVLHTKLRVILLGLVAGLVPFLVAAAVGGGTLAPFAHWEYLGFALLLVPVSFGLAIMRYGALDAAFVVRASLVYGLVTLVIVAGYVAITALLGTWMQRVYEISAYPVLVVTIAACSLAVLPLRRRVQGWVDAAFYPSRRANRNAIMRIGRDLAGQVQAEDAHAMLLDRLHALYRPTQTVLYLGQATDSPDLAAMGRRPDGTSTTGAPARLPLNDPLVACLDRLRRPMFREECEDLGTVVSADPARHRHDLFVPLVTGNRLLGLILLGPKDGGALYSQEDLANLASLALQAGPVLESLRLYTETLRQRQLATELAVAREIQAQLLPTGPLVAGNARICGRNDSCLEVGGDYYDYFLLGDGHELAFCIADVAGKGIPASLLMTTLRVTFRELARPTTPPESVLGELDRRLGELLAPERFVSFFYGVLDLRQHVLSYCNAGLEPPLLLRAAGDPIPLRRGGPVLGIGAGVPHRRGTVRLDPGDLVIGYTDGITEQMSPDGKEFFEVERLEAMVATLRDRSPEELCGEIFARVGAFGGRDVSDDRTVIVLKYQ